MRTSDLAMLLGQMRGRYWPKADRVDVGPIAQRDAYSIRLIADKPRRWALAQFETDEWVAAEMTGDTDGLLDLLIDRVTAAYRLVWPDPLPPFRIATKALPVRYHARRLQPARAA